MNNLLECTGKQHISTSITIPSSEKGLPTHASRHVPGGVGVTLVTLAQVRGVGVLTEAVVTTDGLVHTLVDI